MLDCPVAGDVHQWRPVLEIVELVRGRKRHPRIVRFVAECAVEFCRMPNGLVNGQPQVRRVDDQVITSRLDGWSVELLDQPPRQLSELAVPVPTGASLVLPASPCRRCDGSHGFEGTGSRVDRYCRELWEEPYA